jgi:ATP-dependent exoDNAse (exonuclease V) beta subunit
VSHFLFDRDLVIRAGAGTGKTHALVTQYLHLLAGLTARRAPVRPGRIVAITFTEKAAAELAARIRQRVARLAGLHSDADTVDLTEAEADLVSTAATLNMPLPPPEHWESCLRELGGAPVGTFHGFGATLLRRHALQAGVDPGFRLLDEAETRERLRRLAEQVVIDALAAHDPEAEALVDELGYDSRGQGMGTVEALVLLHTRRAEEGRDAAGLADNYDPPRLRQELEAAVAELRRTARALVTLAQGGALADGSARKVQDLALDLPSLLLTIDPSDARAPAQVDALIDSVKNLRTGRGGDAERLKAAVAELREAREALDAALLAFRATPLARALERLLGDLGRRYDEDKRRLGVLDFSDLLVRARTLLAAHPRIRAAERARFDALLVDEFQDTNPVQAELVRLLADPEPADRPGEDEAPAWEGNPDPDAATASLESATAGRLLVVGDRKQSIYEFRGADVAVAVTFEATRAEARTRRLSLGVSRRSQPALVHLCNDLFAHLMRGGAGAFAVRFEEEDRLAPLRPGEAECAAELLALAPSVLGAGAAGRRAGASGTGRPDAHTLRTLEAAAVAERFSELRAAGQRGLALLLRAFTHVDVYLEALRGVGLPYYVVNGRGFFETEEVRDLAAALRLLDDPDDALALVTVLRSPLVALSDESLLRLRMAGRLGAGVLLPRGIPEDVLEAMDAGERARLERFRALHHQLALRADRLGPAGCLRALVDGTELEVVLAAGHHGEQRVANLLALVDRARRMELAGTDLRGFVRWLATLAAGGGPDAAQAQIVGEADDGVVRVMTVHQSKGLEFPVVAVAGCGTREPPEVGPVRYDASQGLGLRLLVGPGRRGDAGASRRVARERTARREAESLRLLYVALTRARDRLILAGESTGGSCWRALIDEALALPEVARRLEVRTVTPRRGGRTGAGSPPPEQPSSASSPSALSPPEDEGATAEAAAVLEAQLAPPRSEAHTLTASVTALGDFAQCPRRYQLFHVVGLSEHPRPARPAPSEALPVQGELDPLARGTLAHHLLEHVDLAAGGEDLDELLVAEGYDPGQPEVAEVRGHVRAFLATPFARGLTAPGVEVWRELPFVLALPPDPTAAPGTGGVLRVRGQIDLLVREGELLTVVDYKHARAGQEEEYRLQLGAYALAARLLRPAERVRVGLAFLREADPSPRWLEMAGAGGDATDELARALASLGTALRRQPAGLWPGKDAATCHALRCGYLYHCHPTERPAESP